MFLAHLEIEGSEKRTEMDNIQLTIYIDRWLHLHNFVIIFFRIYTTFVGEMMIYSKILGNSNSQKRKLQIKAGLKF